AFAITVAEGEAKLIDAKVDPSGPSGNGSTSVPGSIWVTNADGTVLGKIDVAGGQMSLTPPVPAGKYLLRGAHASGEVGANDFYVVRTFVAPDNPPETEDDTNGTVGTAEPLAVESKGGVSQAFVLIRVGDGDVDYFRFDGTAGQTVTADCVSRDDGSGV